jgi:hypothetical protein
MMGAFTQETEVHLGECDTSTTQPITTELTPNTQVPEQLNGGDDVIAGNWIGEGKCQMPNGADKKVITVLTNAECVQICASLMCKAFAIERVVSSSSSARQCRLYFAPISGVTPKRGISMDCYTSILLLTDPTSTSTTPTETLNFPLRSHGYGCCETHEVNIQSLSIETEEACLDLCRDSLECRALELQPRYWGETLQGFHCRTFTQPIISGNHNSGGRSCKSRTCWEKLPPTTNTMQTTARPVTTPIDHTTTQDFAPVTITITSPHSTVANDDFGVHIGNGKCKTSSGIEGKRVATTTGYECAQKCEITRCTGFAILHEPHECHVYFDTVQDVVATPGLDMVCYAPQFTGTSSPSSSQTTLTSIASCSTEEGYDYYGNDLPNGNIESKSAEECCAACKDRSGCSHYTYIWGSCWLKSSSAGREPNQQGISGSIAIASTPFNTLATYYTTPIISTTGTTLGGSFVLTAYGKGCCETTVTSDETLTVENVHQCMETCQTAADCYGVEIDPQNLGGSLAGVTCRFFYQPIKGVFKTNGHHCKSRTCWAKMPPTMTTTTATELTTTVTHTTATATATATTRTLTTSTSTTAASTTTASTTTASTTTESTTITTASSATTASTTTDSTTTITTASSTTATTTTTRTTTTSIKVSTPSGQPLWQPEVSSTPVPTTTTYSMCTREIATGFQISNPKHLSGLFTKFGRYGGRPTFKASGGTAMYWYWMASPLGVWASGDAVGSMSVYA